MVSGLNWLTVSVSELAVTFSPVHEEELCPTLISLSETPPSIVYPASGPELIAFGSSSICWQYGSQMFQVHLEVTPVAARFW